MSSTQQFICYPCGQLWRDEYTFWRGYLSPCPACGKECQATCDTQVTSDMKEMEGLFDGPLFDFEGDGFENAKADLEGERDLIHDEIAEALGAIEPDTNDVDDSDADSDRDDSGDGY